MGLASQLGGLVGQNAGVITDCYSLSSIAYSEDQYGSEIGGLVGLNEGTGNVTRCYSAGQVIGGSNLGGLVGTDSGTVTDSFYDSEASGYDAAGGGGSGWTAAGTPKSTAEMKLAATYTDTATAGLVSSWDFCRQPERRYG